MQHSSHLITALAVTALAVSAHPASAGCPNVDATAVVLVPDIISDTPPLPSGTTIIPVVSITNPPLSEIQQSIEDFLEGQYPYGWNLQAVIGNYGLWGYSPTDYGAVAIADTRDGTIVFAGHMVWAGTGDVAFPTADTHSIADSGTPAPPPIEISTFPNGAWAPWLGYGTIDDLTDKAVELLGFSAAPISFTRTQHAAITGYSATHTLPLSE